MGGDISNTQTVGTCSLCGGPVKVPLLYHSVIPPTPTCSRCGAIAAENFGPTIPMTPQRPHREIWELKINLD